MKIEIYLKTVLISCLPVLEIWIIVELINAFGGFATLALVVLSTIGGLVLTSIFSRRYITPNIAKKLGEIDKSQSLEQLSDEEFENFIIVLGSIMLLITPGFLSDILGIACLFRPLGRPVAKTLVRAVDRASK